MTESQRYATNRVNFGRLLECYKALSNLRATAFAVTGVLVSIMFVVAGVMARSDFISTIAILFAVFALLTGISVAGVLLMDQARDVELRGAVDAVVFGVICVLKLIVVLLALALLVALCVGAIAVAMAIGRVPGVGPVIFAVVFPVSVGVLGVAIFAILFIFLPLAFPALWEGRGIVDTLTMMITMARERLVMAVISEMAVLLVCLAASLVVYGIFVFGFVSSAGIAGMAGGMDIDAAWRRSSSFDFEFFRTGETLFAIVALSGIAIYFVANALVWQVYVMGQIMVYLTASEGLDLTRDRQAIEQGLERARESAREAQRKAVAATERAKRVAEESRPKNGAGNSQSVALEVASCPACRASIASADVFCGNCGYKLI